MYFFYYIPVGINAPLKRFPFLTFFYSFLCAVIFICNKYLSHYLTLDFYNLIYIPHASPMISAITAAFLHFGYFHLIGNLIFLILFGRYVEDRLGSVAFTFVFLSSAWVGNYIQGVFNLNVLHESYMGIIGASSAISGIMGVFIVRFLASKIKVAYWVFLPLQAYTKAGFVEVPAFLAIVAWFILQVAKGLLQFGPEGSNVAYMTHISAFIWGVFVALALGQLAKGHIEAFWDRAQKRIRQGDYFSAQADLLKYLEAEREDGRAYASLARTQLLTGDTAGSWKSYRRACELLLESLRRGEAEDVYREALHGFDDFVLNPGEQLDLAFGLERNLKSGLALRAYENFSARYPHHAEAPFALLRAANLQLHTFSDGDGAMDCYHRLVSKYQGDPWVDFAREQMRLLGGV